MRSICCDCFYVLFGSQGCFALSFGAGKVIFHVLFPWSVPSFLLDPWNNVTPPLSLLLSFLITAGCIVASGNQSFSVGNPIRVSTKIFYLILYRFHGCRCERSYYFVHNNCRGFCYIFDSSYWTVFAHKTFFWCVINLF